MTLRGAGGAVVGRLRVFALTSGWCALRQGRQPAIVERREDHEKAEEPARIRWHPLAWMALAACGSVMLLATTNQMCQEMAVIPFLWILPLAIYLLSFILCFESERWYRSRPLGVVLLLRWG